MLLRITHPTPTSGCTPCGGRTDRRAAIPQPPRAVTSGHGHPRPPGEGEALMQGTGLHARAFPIWDEVTSFSEGRDLDAPGISYVHAWRPDPDDIAPPDGT